MIAGDGCLSEGVSHEAASLAGHLGLGRLIAVYDDNHITIDGPTELALTDDATGRFRAYGWHVLELGEVANDLDALEAGVREAMAEPDRPSLAGPALPHRLAVAQVDRQREGPRQPVLRGRHPRGQEPPRPPARRALLRARRRPRLLPRGGHRGAPLVADWRERLAVLRERDPGLVDDYDACIAGTGKTGWEAKLPSWPAGDGLATREACKEVLDAIVDVVPGLVGGGADLTGNTGTAVPDGGILEPGALGGRQIYFGVREHGMNAVMNGMSVSGLLPFGGTFFVFSDYGRGAVRLAALSRLQGRVRLVARLGRRRRGRPHAPAGRAARGDAGDARPAGDPAGRRQRDRGRVAHPHRRRRPDRADPVPPEGAGARGHGRRRDRRRGRRRVRAAARVRRRTRRRAGRHRLRGVAVRRRPPRRSPRPASRCASCRCRAGSCSRRASRPTATRCCRRACRRSRSRRRPASAGTATPTPP